MRRRVGSASARPTRPSGLRSKAGVVQPWLYHTATAVICNQYAAWQKRTDCPLRAALAYRIISTGQYGARSAVMGAQGRDD
jgi:hypothetical protein